MKSGHSRLVNICLKLLIISLNISKLKATWLAVGLVSMSNIGLALPVNFGISQGDIEYSELTSENFKVYFDSRVPEEGVVAMHSLEAAKPLVEQWIGKSRESDDPLKAVMSGVSRNASFANFIFDAIELQTPGQNIRDLAWHEYAHSTMYLHYHNLFGPPGSVLHLLWMPAWFLEGLAETLSVSVGSTDQAGIERWQALQDNWPTYDRLHSLYQNPKWIRRGYATAGSFVAWILRKMYRENNDIHSLNDLLADFKDETMPWNLLSNYMHPMEDSFEKATGMKGEALYEAYKADAKRYWLSKSPAPLLSNPSQSKTFFKGSSTMLTRGDTAFLHTTTNNGQFELNNVIFDEESNWATSISPEAPSQLLPEGAVELTYIDSKQMSVYVAESPSVAKAARRALMVSFKPDFISKDPLKTRPRQQILSNPQTSTVSLETPAQKQIFQKVHVGGRITKLYETLKMVAWYEVSEKDKKLCYASKRLLSRAYEQRKTIKPTCNVVAKGAVDMAPIGNKTTWNEELQAYITEEIWIRRTDSSMIGDRHQLLTWYPKTNKLVHKKNWPPAANPVSVAFAGNDTWMLTADRTSTQLWSLDKTSKCSEAIAFSDYILDAQGMQNGSVVLQVYEGFSTSFKTFDPGAAKKIECLPAEPHTSPIIEGLKKVYRQKLARQDQGSLRNHKSSQAPNHLPPSFREVLFASSPWKDAETGAIPAHTPDAKKDSTIQDGLDLTDEPVKTVLQPDTMKTHEPANNVHVSTHDNENFASAPTITSDTVWTKSKRYTERDISPAQTRWSSPLYFPWLGGEDPRGTQLGLISVPLIDDLQNQTVRATVLVGLESQFPSTDITYSNGAPDWPVNLSLYRQQTYNGSLIINNESYVNYWDEKGVRLSTGKSFRFGSLWSFFGVGLKYADFTPYLGYTLFNNKGRLTEPYITISTSRRFSSSRSAISFGIRHSEASKLLNENFDFNKTGVNLSLSKGIFQESTLSTGISYAQTRGPRPMYLREFYTPLRTHIPGSGGGLNQSNFDFTGSGSLFGARFGDTKIRSNLAFSTPIISDLDKLVWIFYAERLDFSAFLNYGGTWFDIADQTIEDATLIGAHGYNIDLQFENKGIRFNVGLGVGQVFEEDFETYGKFGFDAFF